MKKPSLDNAHSTRFAMTPKAFFDGYFKGWAAVHLHGGTWFSRQLRQGMHRSARMVADSLHYTAGNIKLILEPLRIVIHVIVDEDDIVQPDIDTTFVCDTCEQAMRALRIIESDGWIVSTAITNTIIQFCGERKVR